MVGMSLDIQHIPGDRNGAAGMLSRWDGLAQLEDLWDLQYRSVQCSGLLRSASSCETFSTKCQASLEASEVSGALRHCRA